MDPTRRPPPFPVVMAAAIVAVACLIALGWGCIWLAVQVAR